MAFRERSLALYSTQDLINLSTYLGAKGYVFHSDMIEECKFNSVKFKDLLTRKTEDFPLRGLENSIWNLIIRSYFGEFNKLPTLLSVASDLPKDIILWRLSEGV